MQLNCRHLNSTCFVFLICHWAPYRSWHDCCSLFSHLVVPNSLWTHAQKHARLPCPSLSPGVCLNSCPLSWWCIHPSHPLLPPFPLAFNLSQHQRIFQWVGSSHQVDKYWKFNFSISPSNEYSLLIFLRIDWFDLLVVQGILKSLQHHCSKAWVLWYSAFFIVQLSHLYMTTGKTLPLTMWTSVSKVMLHGW